MPLKVEVCGISETGLVREGNEDAWGQLDENNFFVLADGMGGHAAGEVASGETVRILCEMMDSVLNDNKSYRTPKEMAVLLRLAIVETNRQVYKLAQGNPALRGMGTTLCTFYLHGHYLVYAHLGDSRIYRFRDGKLEQLTEDHSLYCQMLKEGKVTEETPDELACKNIVTKCVGTGWLVDPAIEVDLVRPGDVLMMCSDGLSDLVGNTEIEAIIQDWNGMVDSASHALVEAALMRGGTDNVTVVMGRVVES